jgi:signal transduction histidine kinase
MAALWRPARGPIATAMLVVIAGILAHESFSIPDVAVISVLIVVAVSVMDGTQPAVLSGLILAAYAAYAHSSPGHIFVYTHATLIRLGIFIPLLFASAILAGLPRRMTGALRHELQVERMRLAEAVRSKSDFMNAAAHQLRTPLTVISGYSSMLQDETFGKLPEHFRAPITVMQRKARQLDALIDQILLSARVQRGTVPTATMTIDVRDAVRAAVERAEPHVTLERGTLTYEMPSSMVLADIDPDHLAHILDNLISNALTYSDGKPWVKITVTGGADARVLVRDRGTGVPEGMRDKIFERFVHYVHPESTPKGGPGLGLSISRELAERYGGSLDLVWTETGKGSLFVLRLPGPPLKA